MRNRVQTEFHEPEDTPLASETVVALRMAALFCVLVVPLIAVAFRLFQLQTGLQTAYAGEYAKEFVHYETIPARNGRILAGSTVLAADVERYDIQAHYRWLQHPVDADWLHQTARELNAEEGRPRDDTDEAKQAVLQRRERMWQDVSALVKIPPRTLSGDLDRVQQRVEKIAASVNRRAKQRRENLANEFENAAKSDSKTDASPFRVFGDQPLPGWFQAIHKAVTTQPQRHRRGRITVVEELDYHTIVSGASLKVAAEIRAHPERFPGLRVVMTSERRYPSGPFAAHVVGTRTKLRAEEVAAQKEDQQQNTTGDKDIDPQDSSSLLVGRTGLERTYDRQLRGIPGLRRIVRNRRGEVIQTDIVREPIAGRDIHTTLNSAWQSKAERLLDAALDDSGKTQENISSSTNDSVPVGGSLVAIDIHSGHVLVAASAPRMDPNIVASGNSSDWNSALGDPRRPLFSRATQMALPPGSVFKALSSVAILENGTIDPDAPFECRGFLQRPDRHRCLIFRSSGHGHGGIQLKQAIAESCNVYFFSAARKIGSADFVNWAQRFGIGQPTGVDLPFESAGNLPGTPHAKFAGKERLDTLGLVIGQSRLLTTPMQIARMMAAIANRGYLLTPRVVDSSGPSIRTSGTIDARSLPEPLRQKIPGLRQETLERVREGLTAVVQHPRGSGFRNVRLAGISIAGKTGTAETGGANDHAWFAGYFPADEPEVAFVVVLEHGGSGGRNAGPIAREFVRGCAGLNAVVKTGS